MDVTVTMTAEEFLEFMDWKKDRSKYQTEMTYWHGKWDMLANKACWAMEKDDKRPGKVKIIDQEHAAELLEMAHDYLE